MITNRIAHVSRSYGWGLQSWCSARIYKGWTRRPTRAGAIAARYTRDTYTRNAPPRDDVASHVSQLRCIVTHNRVGVTARQRYGGILLHQRRGALRRGELHVHARYADRVAVLAEGVPRPRAAKASRPAMPSPPSPRPRIRVRARRRRMSSWRRYNQRRIRRRASRTSGPNHQSPPPPAPPPPPPPTTTTTP